VAIANAGVIFNSTSGIDWQRIQTCTWYDFHGLAYGAGTYVAVGDSGTIFVSPNGRNWHAAKSGTLSNLEAITYGSGKFVVSGDRGTICYSEDAINWKISPSFQAPELRYIAFGAGVFLAGSYPDGLFKSKDAVNWRRTEYDTSLNSENIIYGLSYVNNRFMAFGYIGSKCAVILVSVDGNVWERKDAGISYDIVGSCWFAKGRYYAYTNGLNKPARKIYASTDLSSWSALCDSAPHFSQCLFAKGMFFGIGYPNRSISSTDLKTWTCRSSEKQQFKFANFHGVAYGARKFVLCDNYGNISTSNDGITWVQNAAQIDIKPVAFLYRAGRFVVVDENGFVHVSPNALEWEQVQNLNFTGFMPGASAHGTCVAVGRLGMIITRKPDSSWVQCRTETDKALTGVAFGAGRFVAVGDQGFIASSSDGVYWNREKSGTDIHLKSVNFSGGRFMAVGFDGCILSSLNGKQWQREISGTTGLLYGVTYGAGQYLAAGQVILSANAAGTGEQANNDDRFIGVWTSDDFSERTAGFLGADSNTFILRDFTLATQDSFTVPAIPEKGISKESFIPVDWDLGEEIAEGDLNGDDVPDIAMVITYARDHIVKGANGPAVSHPRILLVLFKDAKRKEYRLAAQNSSIIIESTDPALEEPFKGLEIKNRVLTITFSFFYSMGTWEVTGNKFKFRYQNGAFALIGEDYSSFWRNRANPDKEISCNYLSGKKQTITEKYSGDESTAETTWTNIGKIRQTIESMGDPFSREQE
jgi:hypothetical protein